MTDLHNFLFGIDLSIQLLMKRDVSEAGFASIFRQKNLIW